jgi:HK97 family phage major capsid protein
MITDQMQLSEDVYLSNGDGIGLNPLGFLRDTSITRVDLEGTTPTTISNSTSDAGSAIKFINMMGKLPSRFASGAVVMMHSETLAAFRGLVDADGRPFFVETYTGMTLVGTPVVLNDGFPTGGTADQPVVVYGNFERGFRLIRKPSGISIRILNEAFAAQDCIGVRGIYRVGGGVILPQAFVIGVADAVS